MENVHTAREPSHADYYLPGYLGSNEIGHHSHAARILDDHQQSWSPVCLSSPSASTEYWSNDTSPYSRLTDWEWPGDGLAAPQRYHPSIYEGPVFPRVEPVEDLPCNRDSSTWCEELTWSEPFSLEDCNRPLTSDEFVIHDLGSETIAETPGECTETLSQDDIDKNTVEMTCGPKLEEHFWPIRYQIRSGKFHVRSLERLNSFGPTSLCISGL
ncbi:hypothetical protein B0H17DRAFT_455708 [Mycena rosella]|uniref:Uncharacterized protein n=1 Tax=Mycena rosella TaxID=1033263 RepID=A0AAD7DP26_MYCRO|nr:hypothetical protein B0H17DRAFT_455708 [Mycena rosella]